MHVVLRRLSVARSALWRKLRNSETRGGGEQDTQGTTEEKEELRVLGFKQESCQRVLKAARPFPPVSLLSAAIDLASSD